MSQSATWDTLQIARDARLCGLTSQYEALLAEAAPDFEYVRRSHQRRIRSARWAARLPSWRAAVAANDWISWRAEPRTVRASADSIEIRFASYANFIRPAWNGVFTVD